MITAFCASLRCFTLFRNLINAQGHPSKSRNGIGPTGTATTSRYWRPSTFTPTPHDAGWNGKMDHGSGRSTSYFLLV